MVLHTGHFNYKPPGWQCVVFLSGATLVVFGFSVVWLCVFVVFLACFCRFLAAAKVQTAPQKNEWTTKPGKANSNMKEQKPEQEF